jgi:hypothetical protein
MGFVGRPVARVAGHDVVELALGPPVYGLVFRLWRFTVTGSRLPRPAQLGGDYVLPVLVAGGELPHVRGARFAQNGTPERTTECRQQAAQQPGPFWVRHGAAPQDAFI